MYTKASLDNKPLYDVKIICEWLINEKVLPDILALYEAKEDQWCYMSSGAPLFFDIYNKYSD